MRDIAFLAVTPMKYPPPACKPPNTGFVNHCPLPRVIADWLEIVMRIRKGEREEDVFVAVGVGPVLAAAVRPRVQFLAVREAIDMPAVVGP